MAKSTLEPCEQPLGPQAPTSGVYFSSQQAVRVKEGLLSLSSDDFLVDTIPDKRPVCRCDGKVMSLHQGKTFVNAVSNFAFGIKCMRLTKILCEE